MKVKVKCQQCGEEFEVGKTRIEKGGGKFCSSKCYGKSQRTSVIKKCVCCNKIFKVTNSRGKKGGGKFCSSKCYGKSRKRKVSCICKQCGEEFKLKPSLIKKGGGKFCSRKCMGNGERGKNHPNWKGGTSPYPSTWTESFRRSIRKRDAFLCALCDRHQDEFNRSHDVHHIDGDKMNTTKENCISMCGRHHMIVEHSGKTQTFWAPRFRKQLSKIHGYKYTEVEYGN